MTHDHGTGGWRRDLGAALLTCVALSGLMLAAGGIWWHVGGSDLHAHFLPRYMESARALMREGRLPLWNPWEFGGTPMAQLDHALADARDADHSCRFGSGSLSNAEPHKVAIDASRRATMKLSLPGLTGQSSQRRVPTRHGCAGQDPMG